MSAVVHHGDCLTVMPTLDADSVDAIVSDPPYGLAFMGKGWDHAVPGVEFWTAALRVAKPGAYLLAFGGTRTYHRLTCAIEDAGWEIHDCLSWLYGSGFPKHASKLKPAWEPIILARKPAKKATPLQVDACRIGMAPDDYAARAEWADKYAGRVYANGNVYGGGKGLTGPEGNIRPVNPAGRWPANVVLDEDAARALDDATADRLHSAGHATDGRHCGGLRAGHRREPGAFQYGGDAPRYGDTGGASRFFYTAKASRREREAGLDGFARRAAGVHDDDSHRRPGERRNNHTAPLPTANHHPTVKPLALMRWLVRLVAPPDGLVLDPFTGSGTTGCAAVMEGLRFVGIEREAEYVAIARARIAHHATQGALALDPAA